MSMRIGEPARAAETTNAERRRNERDGQTTRRVPRRLRRNRRGKAPRNSLYPASVPWHRTPTELFESFMLESAERLEELWGNEVSDIAFVLMDVPDAPDVPVDGARADAFGPHPIALGQAIPALVPSAGALAGAQDRTVSSPARIVLYRMPIQQRAHGQESLAALIHDVTVEQFARLMGLEPQNVDPRYRFPEERF